MEEQNKLNEWFNNTPHDMGKEEYDSLLVAVESELQRRIERYADLKECPDPYDEREGIWFNAAKMKAIVDERVQAQLQAAKDQAREE